MCRLDVSLVFLMFSLLPVLRLYTYTLKGAHLPVQDPNRHALSACDQVSRLKMLKHDSVFAVYLQLSCFNILRCETWSHADKACPLGP